MDWSQYTYLLGIAAVAVALLLIAARFVPGLIHPTDGRKRPPSEVTLLGAVLALGVMTIYWNCLFGSSRFGYWDLGSDTLEEYVPYYVDMVNSLKSGTWGLWDFTYGLGTTFMAYDVWAFDPFNLITVPLTLLLGTAQLGRILVVVQAVKIFLAAYLFDHLLTFYCKAPLSRIVGASLFAFGGWLVLWGQHYWLGAVYVCSTLLVLLVELLMERWTAPRFLGVMITSTLSVLMGVYSGFMVLLFAAFYAILRSVQVSQAKAPGEFFRFFGKLSLPVICGVFAAGIMIIPYAFLVLNDTARVTDANGLTITQRALGYLTSFVPLQWIPLIASRLLGNGLLYTGDVFSNNLAGTPQDLTYLMNSYEFLLVGAGALTLVLCSQCLARVFSKTERRTITLVIITCALIFLFCVNEFLPALFSAFDLKYRASYVLLFPLCIASACGWECIVTYKEVHLSSFWGSTIITLAIIIWSLVSTTNGRLICVYYLLATILFAAIVAVVITRQHGASHLSSYRPLRLIILLACLVVLSPVIVDGFFSTNARGIADASNFPAASNADADTEAALEYLHATDTGFYRIGKNYTDWTTYNDSMIQGYNSVSSYNSLMQANIIEFYRELWPELLSDVAVYQDYSRDPYEVGLNRLLGVRYILSREQLDQDWLELVNRFGNVYVYKDILPSSIGRASFVYVSESEASSTTLEDRRSLLSSTIIIPDDVASSLELSSFDATAPRTIEPSSFFLTGAGSLDGTMDAISESVACLSIPNTAGWTIYVDGEPVDTFRADYGFIGFVLPEGSHQISARYVPVGLYQGAALSLCGVMLGCISCALLAKRRNHN